MYIEQISAEVYAKSCENILGEPVSMDEVYEDPVYLSIRVREMLAMLECGVTTKTEH